MNNTAESAGGAIYARYSVVELNCKQQTQQEHKVLQFMLPLALQSFKETAPLWAIAQTMVVESTQSGTPQM